MKLTHLLLVVFSLAIFKALGQKTKAVVIFVDGTEKVGFAKLPYSDKGIKFWASKKAKKELIPLERVDTLKTDDATYYVRTKIKDVEKPALMHCTMQVEKVFLYTDYGTANLPITISQASSGGSRFYAVASYFLRKSEDQAATFIGTDQTSYKTLEKALLPFFKDCPKLLQRIKDRQYSRKKMWELVHYYDKNCPIAIK